MLAIINGKLLTITNGVIEKGTILVENGKITAVGADIADAVWYFAAHARNTTGAELVVDGGNTIQLYPIIPEE